LSVESLPGTLLPLASVTVTLVSRPPSTRTFTGWAGFTLAAPSFGITAMCAGGTMLLLSLPSPEHPANSVAAARTAPATRQAAHDRLISGLHSRPLDLIEPRSNRRTRHYSNTLPHSNCEPAATRQGPTQPVRPSGRAGWPRGFHMTPSHQRELVRRHADR
jgi:hypothetical protein